MARYGSADIALRYAVVIIAVMQLCSILVAKSIIAQGKTLSGDEGAIDAKVLGTVAEALV
jgi:YQGE family putative transporter